VKPRNLTEGYRFRVIHCKRALDTFDAEIAKVPPHMRIKVAAVCVGFIERLADGGKLTKKNFPPEADLPQNGGKFYAIKKIPMRAYYWQSKRLPGTYFISHYLYKKKDDLDQTDIAKVHSNWRRIEVEMENE
jgi:hypothetical protein